MDTIENRNQTVPTLLISENLMPSFFLLKNHGTDNVTLYLRNLLEMYRTLTHSGMIPKPIKVKTGYQEEGQNLKRIGFRPNNIHPSLHVFATSAFAWIELGELALAFGISRCWLFV